MTPRIDVAVPCYKYGHLLRGCVDSILSQEGVDARVLIIDDCSPDGSGDVAREIAASDPRVEALVHTENKGHIITFNEGILDWAEAPLTLLLSADDALAPGALGRAATLMNDHPNVAFCYGNAPRLDGTPQFRTGPWKPIIYDGYTWLKDRCERAANPIYTVTCVVRTELQKKVGGYRADMLHTSDLDMWLKLTPYGDVGFVAGPDQGFYRMHDANMSYAYYDDLNLRDFELRLYTFVSVLERIRDQVPDADHLEQLVRRRLAHEALVTVGRSYDKGEGDTPAKQKLVEFAKSTTDVTKMPEWYTLKLREAMGPKLAKLTSPLVLTAVGRRFKAQRDKAARVNEGM